MTIIHLKCVLKYRLRNIKKSLASTHYVLTRKSPTLLEKRQVKRHQDLAEVIRAHARLRAHLVRERERENDDFHPKCVLKYR